MNSCLEIILIIIKMISRHVKYLLHTGCVTPIDATIATTNENMNCSWCFGRK